MITIAVIYFTYRSHHGKVLFLNNKNIYFDEGMIVKIKKISYISLLVISLSNYAIAGEDYPTSNLNVEREQVIRQYITNLEKADYQGISLLFNEEGTVASTSRGNVKAKDFFYSFLPNIESARTEFHQAFISNSDNNRYAVRFHFDFKLKDGETGDGEYIDEFLFSNNSTKLVSVYMFENLKFNLTN